MNTKPVVSAKKLSAKLIFVALLLIFTSKVFAGKILVITHVDNQVPLLTKQQTVNIFMSGTNEFGLTPLALSKDASEVRQNFNTFVIGFTESRIRSYWAQMRFSGRGKPPSLLGSEQDVIAKIMADTTFIGYVSEGSDLPKNVQVVFSIDVD